MNPTIRLATLVDARDIARVRVITWQHAYRGLIPQAHLDGLDLEQQHARWQENLATLPAERRVFVAEAEDFDGVGRGGVVGFCACGPERSLDVEYPGEIYALYVLPEVHRRGLGRGLVRAGAAFLWEAGFQRLIIYVLSANAPSRAFYEALGGRVVREKEVEIGGAWLAEAGYGYDIRELLTNW